MTETNLIDCEVQHAERENFKSEEMTDVDVIAIMQAIEEKIANSGLVADKAKIFWNELECPNNYNFDPTSDIDRQRIVDMFTFVGKYNVCVEEDYIELTKCEPKVEIYIEDQKKLESKEMSAADVIAIMEAIENKIIENEFVDGRVKVFWNELEHPYNSNFDLTNVDYKVQIAAMYALISKYNVCLEEDYIELIRCNQSMTIDVEEIAMDNAFDKKQKNAVSKRCPYMVEEVILVVGFIILALGGLFISVISAIANNACIMFLFFALCALYMIIMFILGIKFNTYETSNLE